MVERIGTIADGAHQFGTETLDELSYSGIGSTVSQDGHRLHEHTDALAQTFIHSTVVHCKVGHFLLPQQHRQDVAEGCLEQQVNGHTMLLAPVIAQLAVDER